MCHAVGENVLISGVCLTLFKLKVDALVMCRLVCDLSLCTGGGGTSGMVTGHSTVGML